MLIRNVVAEEHPLNCAELTQCEVHPKIWKGDVIYLRGVERFLKRDRQLQNEKNKDITLSIARHHLVLLD